MGVTIRDVAKLANVGQATVSSYINGGNVREENRIRIQNAIDELHFEVNEVARGLKTSKTKTIGIVIPELDSNFYAEICMKIEDLLRAHGYAIIITDSRSDAERETEAIEFLQKKRIDGLIIVPLSKSETAIKKFMSFGKPVVLLDRLLPDIEGMGCILIDNMSASGLATQKLIDAGHTEIGIIIGPSDIYTSIERKKGYIKVLEKNEIVPNENLIVHGNYTIAGGISALKKLVNTNPTMTAVVLTNYDMTIGAIIAVNELAIKIPSELAVIGFDCKDFAKAVTPNLDIIIQPINDIAKNAADELLKRLNQPENEWKSEIIELDTIYIKGHTIN